MTDIVAKDGEEEMHGYKLVWRDTYEPLYLRHCSATNMPRYVPGTTQWIVWDDLRGTHPPPAPRMCTSTALHFCRRAVETLMFSSGITDVSNLVLLRVTPVRWPTAAPSDTPLFTEETGTTGDTIEPPKCGAHGLRVDGEVTDAAERSALLSGTVEYTEAFRGKYIATFVDGRRVSCQFIDLLGNCTYMSANGVSTWFVYACVTGGGGNVGDEISTDGIKTSETASDLIRTEGADWTTLLYGEPMYVRLRLRLRVLKRYTRAEAVALVK